jgi:hypothetical protein
VIVPEILPEGHRRSLFRAEGHYEAGGRSLRSGRKVTIIGAEIAPHLSGVWRFNMSKMVVEFAERIIMHFSGMQSYLNRRRLADADMDMIIIGVK